MKAKVKSQEPAPYVVRPQAQACTHARNALPTSTDDDLVVLQALEILRRRIRRTIWDVSAPADIKAFLRCQTAHLEHEVFGCIYLDTKNRVIDSEILFSGTLTQTSVYPREVVRHALIKHNAASVVFWHNHPSGDAEPSSADIALTSHLKKALALVDIRVLDHIIVVPDTTVSLAERGLM